MTRKMEAAIAALLTAPTIAAAAHAVGVSEITLWRWLQREEFQVRYREAKSQAVAQSIARLQQVSGEAVETLREVMANTESPASSRVAAAKAVLEMAIKAVELEDLTARVEELERLAREGNQNANRRCNK